MVIFILTTTFAVVAAIYFGRRAYILAGLLADSESARTADQEYYESIESVNEYMFSQIESAYNKMTEIDIPNINTRLSHEKWTLLSIPSCSIAVLAAAIIFATWTTLGASISWSFIISSLINGIKHESTEQPNK